MDKITGEISPIKRINGEMLSEDKIDGNLTKKEKIISGNISTINTISGNIYSKQKIVGNVTYGNGWSIPMPIYDGGDWVTKKDIVLCYGSGRKSSPIFYVLKDKMNG